MEYTIRSIRESELEQLLDLYTHLHNDDPIQKSENELKVLWERMFRNESMHYIVADVNGQLVGSCVLVIIQNLTRNTRPYGLIENVVTHKSFRRKGIGKAVLSEALSISKRQDCYKVMLLTGSNEEGTLRFYEEAGFRRGIKTGFIANLSF